VRSFLIGSIFFVANRESAGIRRFPQVRGWTKLAGECFFESLLFLHSDAAIDSDFKHDISLFHDEAGVVAYGQVVGVIAHASDGRNDDGLDLDGLGCLESIAVLQHKGDDSYPLVGVDGLQRLIFQPIPG
jgi:hypothetical protein